MEGGTSDPSSTIRSIFRHRLHKPQGVILLLPAVSSEDADLLQKTVEKFLLSGEPLSFY